MQAALADVNHRLAFAQNATADQIDFLMPDVHGDVTVSVKNEVASDEAVIPVE